MPGLNLANMTAANLIGGLLFGSIGFVAFVYGKRLSLWRPMFLGLALMAFPYFVEATLPLYAIGSVGSACFSFFATRAARLPGWTPRQRFTTFAAMSDETTQIIAGDTLAAASEEYPGARKGFPGRRKRPRKGSFCFTHCENCDTPLRGLYCSACGQAAIDYRRSFRYVIVDVLDSFLNWDSKFIATIGWLIVRPWYLTNNFLTGRRVRYLHPLRLYLLASILFFFAVTYLTKSMHVNAPLSPEARAKIEEQLKREDLPPETRARMEKQLKREESYRRKAPRNWKKP